MSSSLPRVLWLENILQKRFGIVDDGPTSYFLGIEVVRDTNGRIMELHQYLPKGKRDGKEFTHMFYSPTTHPSFMQNMSIIDSPVTREDKALMSHLPCHAAYSTLCRGLREPALLCVLPTAISVLS